MQSIISVSPSGSSPKEKHGTPKSAARLKYISGSGNSGTLSASNTAEILNKVEEYDRGFYTGIFGFFDGENLDSSVMIRFIEIDKKGELFYKSGGGITCDSNILNEYQELIDKIYLPF